MSNLEPQHTPFDSVEQMLMPARLSQLRNQPITRVVCTPMSGHTGLAGGQLSYVETDAGRLVLKRMSAASDWIMFTSGDDRCRFVALWQYGLLDRLRPQLEHKIVGCAKDGAGWAILMDDLTGHVYSWGSPMPARLVPVFLDELARLHATFWNDPHLNDPRLGLCSPEQLLDQTSLQIAQKYQHLSLGVIPEWVRGGWEVMEMLLDRDVFLAMRELSENPQPLFEALKHLPFTLLHGDYRAENLAYHNQPVALDWQEATCSLMTIDLAWFVKNDYVQNALGEAQAVSYYRQRLETYLGCSFDDQEWQAMLDLGYLMDALRSTCFSAYWHKQHAIANNAKDRDYLELEVKTRNQQVRDALRWINLA